MDKRYIKIMNFLRNVKVFFRKWVKGDSHFSDSSENKISNSYIDSESISSLSSASLKLESNLGIKSTGRCGICVKDVNLESFNDMKKYIENFLGIASDEKKYENLSFSFNSFLDEYNYLWFILNGQKIEDVVAGINAVGDTIHDKGFSRQLLAAVFEFTTGYENRNDEGGNVVERIEDNRASQYLIYNYKSDNFYPFVPTGTKSQNGKRKRDNQMEVKIMKEISNEIPFEEDLSRWYPIWNIPF